MLASQVRYGQGHADAWQHYDLRTEEGVKQFLADHGYPDFSGVIEEVRPKSAVLPLETHLFSTGLDVNLPPGGKSYVAIRDGYQDLARIEGESGRLVMSQYQERFRHSVRNLERCTTGEEADYGDLLSCFADGLVSIEAFVNYKAEPHRDKLPRGDERIVALDFKLNRWIPLLSGGVSVDKNQRFWQDFREIQNIRDERQSHPKASVYGVSDSEFCKQLNLWRTGIALMLLALHTITGRQAPPELIKHAYLPDIELVVE